jgi:hypothetical protein
VTERGKDRVGARAGIGSACRRRRYIAAEIDPFAVTTDLSYPHYDPDLVLLEEVIVLVLVSRSTAWGNRVGGLAYAVYPGRDRSSRADD